MSFVEVIKDILRSNPAGLTPQQVREVVKLSYPDYYGTESHRRNVDNGNYKNLDHAILAQIYSSSRNSRQIEFDRNQKPLLLKLVGDGAHEGQESGTSIRVKRSNPLSAHKKGSVAARPTAQLVDSYLDKFKELENYKLQEQSLRLLFRELCPRNDCLEHVLLKVSALNDFYSTNIFDTYSVARHIFEAGIDERLVRPDFGLVNEIALVSVKGKTKNNYSFASKYCSHHVPESYPVFDSYVEKMLWHYKLQDDFDRFARPDLKQYRHFVQIIEAFQSFYGLAEYSLREIDIFLWLAGKEWFPKNY